MSEPRANAGPPTIPVANPTGVSAGLWRWAQRAGVVTTAVIVVGLIVVPSTSLELFWNVAVPVLPAVFVLNPMVWRNVCPLASFNRFTADRWSRKAPATQWTEWAPVAGIVLLYLLVPARRFLFNADGLALATTIVAVAVLALVMGLAFEGKSGFCNGICPVLSVERLYGQRPFAEVTNARCAPCTRCTGRGCIDLTTEKSVAQTLGKARQSRRWLASSFGLFAASFPGFVFGYFTAANGPLTSAPQVYLHMLMWSGVSAGLTALLVLFWPQQNRRILLGLGAAAVATYYWFAAPTLSSTLGLPSFVGLAARTLGLIVAFAWLVRGWNSTWRTAVPA
jgi:nitrite reductase (NADH) large subunit